MLLMSETDLYITIEHIQSIVGFGFKEPINGLASTRKFILRRLFFFKKVKDRVDKVGKWVPTAGFTSMWILQYVVEAHGLIPKNPMYPQNCSSGIASKTSNNVFRILCPIMGIPCKVELSLSLCK